MRQDSSAGNGITNGVPDPTPQHTGPSGMFRFGAFELRTHTGELWKHGIRVRLQAKPLQVLEALLERPGELVTRDELRRKLWPAGTFVDFENGLNTAINRLRAALGDSAEAPRYIETLPRLGYRFICPVARIEGSESRWTSLPGSHLRTAVRPPSGDQEPTSKRGVDETKFKEAVPAIRQLNRFSVRAALAAISVLAILLIVGYLHSEPKTTRPQPAFRQLTFRTGVIESARFLPDEQTAVFSARWQDGNLQTYTVDLDSLKLRPLSFAPGELVSVSQDGNLILASGEPPSLNPIRLWRVSLRGGAAENLAERASGADWSADGRELALIRDEGLRSSIEFPVGHVTYNSPGWINELRVSPCGDHAAFLEHPMRDDTAGHLRIIDKHGKTTFVTGEWNNIEGLAWSPCGSEVWFTASKSGSAQALFAVSETGKLRQVSSTGASVRLLDISSKGRALVAVDDVRITMRGALSGDTLERDLSKFDASHVEDISADGKLLLFTEAGEGGGQHYTAYIYDQEKRNSFPVAAGRAFSISPDKQWVLTLDPRDRTYVTLNAIGGDQPRKVLGNGFEYQWAKFLPDGKRLLVGGAYPGKQLGIYTQNIASGALLPLSGSPYMEYAVISPDGRRIAGVTAGFRIAVFDMKDKTLRQLGSLGKAYPIAWSSHADYLYYADHGGSGYRILKLNIQTEKAEIWKTIVPGEPAGVVGLAHLVIAPEAGAYAYSNNVNLSRFYLVDGWS